MKSNSPSGIVLIDKPVGPSSFNIVSQLRKKIGLKKIGHAGTLDPLASGLLLVGVGGATKYLEYLVLETKGYEVSFQLGKKTNTDDLAGEITFEKEVNFESSHVGATLNTFLGKIQQVPPDYSAIKVSGKRAYQSAREGEVVILAARNVEVYELSQFEFLKDRGSFFMSCSKGTYVRSLIRDLGNLLECGAVTTSIRRVSSGAFHVSQAMATETFTIASSPADFSFLNAADIFPSFGVLELTQELWNKKVQFGNALTEIDLSVCAWLRQGSEPHVILRLNGSEEVALGHLNSDKSLCVKKLL